MEWIGENWIWLLLGGGMIGMHLFGHGKRGGGGGCCGGAGDKDQASRSEGASTTER